MSLYEECEENLQWKKFMGGEKQLRFHRECQKCNRKCNNPVLRYRKFDKEICKRKQKREKANNKDNLENILLKTIERKLSEKCKQ